jgi:hypothetical protein
MKPIADLAKMVSDNPAVFEKVRHVTDFTTEHMFIDVPKFMSRSWSSAARKHRRVAGFEPQWPMQPL